MKIIAFFAGFVAWATTAVAIGGGHVVSGAAKVVTSEYRFPARSDPLVNLGVVTEIWAQVWRPLVLPNNPLPVLLFIHGAHTTCGKYDSAGFRIDENCQYTFNGTCPDSWPVVVPNHLGYSYLAEPLAAKGYFVISINTNRGINCARGPAVDPQYITLRGKMVNRHLGLWNEWNAGRMDVDYGAAPESLGFNPRGRLDLSQVGLMGHSRGGEAVRAALQLMRENPNGLINVRVRAIFMIAPTDFGVPIDPQDPYGAHQMYNADGVASAVLLPTCDGDVVNLEGMRVFDRTFEIDSDRVAAIKSTILVYGANHNFYNTEWQVSDADGCVLGPALFPPIVGSEAQRQTAIKTIVPFFIANVGRQARPALNAVFNTGKRLPKQLLRITKFMRNYLPGPVDSNVRILQKFTGESGFSDSGVRNTAVGLDVVHSAVIDSYNPYTVDAENYYLANIVAHDPSIRWASLSWGNDTNIKHFYEVVLADKGSLRLDGYRTLAFRAALRCPADDWCPGFGDDRKPEISVALVDSNGKLSRAESVKASKRLQWPQIAYKASADYPPWNISWSVVAHELLATLQIDLWRFPLSTRKRVRAIRFIFSGQATGRIGISSISVSNKRQSIRSDGFSPVDKDGAGSSSMPVVNTHMRMNAHPLIRPAPVGEVNSLAIVKLTDSTAMPDANSAADGVTHIGVRLTSARRFQVTSSAPVLWIGQDSFIVSGFSADLHAITFIIPCAKYTTLPAAAPVRLQIALHPSWDFGSLEGGEGWVSECGGEFR